MPMRWFIIWKYSNGSPDISTYDASNHSTDSAADSGNAFASNAFAGDAFASNARRWGGILTEPK
jgi:hypothetical protein